MRNAKRTRVPEGSRPHGRQRPCWSALTRPAVAPRRISKIELMMQPRRCAADRSPGTGRLPSNPRSRVTSLASVAAGQPTPAVSWSNCAANACALGNGPRVRTPYGTEGSTARWVSRIPSPPSRSPGQPAGRRDHPVDAAAPPLALARTGPAGSGPARLRAAGDARRLRAWDSGLRGGVGRPPGQLDQRPRRPPSADGLGGVVPALGAAVSGSGVP
jgi:hypothetical protein